ncbi:MAG: hypothetical protein U0166_12900 [Acidobacteriota bacterium]
MRSRSTAFELVMGRLPGVAIVGGFTYLVARDAQLARWMCVALGLAAGTIFELAEGEIVGWILGVDGVGSFLRRT